MIIGFAVMIRQCTVRQPIYSGVPYLSNMCGADLSDLERNARKEEVEKNDGKNMNASNAKKS